MGERYLDVPFLERLSTNALAMAWAARADFRWPKTIQPDYYITAQCAAAYRALACAADNLIDLINAGRREAEHQRDRKALKD